LNKSTLFALATMIDLNEILIFARVAHEGSFTRAAKQLGLPKSTVSERVSSLEARLGVKLLDRSTRGLRLTPVGSAYFEECTRIISAAERADASASEVTQVPRGRLRIGGPHLFTHLVLGRFVTRFAIEYPDVEIEFVISDVFREMKPPLCDLVVQTRGSLDPSLIARRIGSTPRRCYASPKYLKANGTPETIEALREHKWIIFGADPEETVKLISKGRVESFTVRGRFTVNSIFVAADAAVAGAGIVILPSFLVADRVRAGELTPVLESWTTAASEIHIVYAPAQQSVLRVRLFVEMLLAEARAEMPWLD
jgi:DNA-binding transcriptional LysR family regulator